jgi:coenzyme F420-reducing hydrogenase delta subunit
MEYMGVERDRLHFSWVSSAESTKFVDVVSEVTEAVAPGTQPTLCETTGEGSVTC